MRRRLAVAASGLLESAPPETVDSAHLPHDMPTRSQLRSVTDRTIMAHWFTSFSVEQQLAYYYDNWLPPGGIEGEGQTWEVDWRPYGGYTRQAPSPAYRDVNDSNAVRYAKEIEAAKRAGLDGFTVDLLSNSTSTASHWPRALALLDACATAGDIDYLPMPDGTTSFTSAGATAIADHLDMMFDRPSATACWRYDGKLVHAPFSPESRGAAVWEAVRDRLVNTHGRDVVQWNCYQSASNLDSATGAPAYNAFSWIVGHGRWGVRNPQGATDRAWEPVDFPATFGKPWMHYAAPQDNRYIPSTGLKYEEADHTAALREMFRIAIVGAARFVQIPTWNDYRESSAIAPSLESGTAWVDLVSFYASWYKLKAKPPIVRDTLFLSWRPHRYDVGTYTAPSPYTTSNLAPRVGPTTDKATVEALAFLTSPATVVIDVGGTVTTTVVTQGMIDAQWDGVVPVKAPHHVGANGTVTAWVERNSAEVAGTRVASPAGQALDSTPLVQDVLYRLRNSRTTD